MIFTSPYPALPIPEDAAIWNVLEQQARDKPDAPAFVCGLTDRALTFRDVLQQAQCICAGLHAAGIKKGDVVVLHSFNCVEYPVVFLALNRLGAISSPSSPLFNADELADQLQLAQAVAVISHSALANAAIDGAAKVRGGSPLRVYAFGPHDDRLDVSWLEDFIAKPAPFPEPPPIQPNDIVTLPFSSGTTDRPKGVELTARAMYAAGLLSSSIGERSQYILGLLPFFHIMATKQFHVSIFMGAAIVILPRFEPNTLLRVVEKYKMKKLALAPPLVNFFAKHPIVDKYDLSHVKFLMSGGAPLGKEIIHAVYDRIGAHVLQGYGMTEFAAAVTYSVATHFRDGASGRLLPNVEMKVKDLETDADLPPNKPGELLFKTPTMMRGYFNNPEANAQTFTADGFIRTGDIGYIDDDGYVFIIDRLKELIKYKGHQVAPAEVEDVVNSHPEVTDSCCVRGVDPSSGEEIPKAFVVRKAGSTLTEQALMDYVAGMVTGYKRVREVEFIDEVPKSLSGKILRKQLQAVQNEKIKAQLASRSRL